MKDRIGNVLAEGQKVVVSLPEASIFGFIAKLEEGGMISSARELLGGEFREVPGRVLVSCVIALPVDQAGWVAQLVRVYDPDKHEDVGPVN